MNKQNEELDDCISELEYMKYELQLETVQDTPKNRLKELQEGLNTIKKYLDLGERQDKILQRIRERKAK